MPFESQDSFPSLSVATGQQHDDFLQSIVGYELFSGFGISMKSEKIPFEDVKHLTPISNDNDNHEVLLMVAALEAFELSRAEDQDNVDSLHDSSKNSDSIFEPLRCCTKLSPPKRFRRRGILWASITNCLLLRSRQSSKSLTKALHFNGV